MKLNQSEPSLNTNQLYAVEKLAPLRGAAFNPDCEEVEDDETVCHPGTRSHILQMIKKWATGREGETIFWLQGMAGTGKSTISRTITRSLIRERHHVASFYFQRNTKEPDRVNAACLFSTIAAQLARQLPPMAGHVRSAIDSPDVRPHIAE